MPHHMPHRSTLTILHVLLLCKSGDIKEWFFIAQNSANRKERTCKTRLTLESEYPKNNLYPSTTATCLKTADGLLIWIRFVHMLLPKAKYRNLLPVSLLAMFLTFSNLLLLPDRKSSPIFTPYFLYRPVDTDWGATRLRTQRYVQMYRPPQSGDR